MRRRQDLENRINGILRVEQAIADNSELIEMGEAEGDAGIVSDAEKAIAALKAEVAKVELDTLLSGEADANDSYLQINAGAGGTESQDWAEMLLRMYLRWCERRRYKADIVEETPGEEAGILSARVEVVGPWAYGYLKAERGVHRLVRISPFDAAKRRHTSFALVEVVPEIEDDVQVSINPDDIKVSLEKQGNYEVLEVNIVLPEPGATR